ncbi:hypothetical protein [Succinimonas amylolytica]|uniref:hypothetical protein n=1 Tax=Succinimonas amylolytica TaxID=83769 RepID=UPI000382785B|nr:hypothetical protein [Succinimonas amylolytica]
MRYKYKCIEDFVLKPQIDSSLDVFDIFSIQKSRMLNNWNRVRFLKLRNDFDGKKHLHHVLVADKDSDLSILPWTLNDLYHYDYSLMLNAESKLADFTTWLYSIIEHDSTEILYWLNGFYSSPDGVTLSVNCKNVSFCVTRHFSDNHYSLFYTGRENWETHTKTLPSLKKEIQKLNLV